MTFRYHSTSLYCNHIYFKRTQHFRYTPKHRESGIISPSGFFSNHKGTVLVNATLVFTSTEITADSIKTLFMKAISGSDKISGLVLKPEFSKGRRRCRIQMKCILIFMSVFKYLMLMLMPLYRHIGINS